MIAKLLSNQLRKLHKILNSLQLVHFICVEWVDIPFSHFMLQSRQIIICFNEYKLYIPYNK